MLNFSALYVTIIRIINNVVGVRTFSLLMRLSFVLRKLSVGEIPLGEVALLARSSRDRSSL